MVNKNETSAYQGHIRFMQNEKAQKRKIIKLRKKRLESRVCRANDKLVQLRTEDLVHSLLSSLDIPPRKNNNEDIYYDEELTTDEFAKLYLQSEILSKYVSEATATPQQCWDKGRQKLDKSEAHCALLNERGFDVSSLPHAVWDSILQKARVIILDLIGESPNMEMFKDAAFGTGATTCHTRVKGDPYFKYNTRDPLESTLRAYPYAVALIRQTPLWAEIGAEANVTTHIGNVVFHVPKKSDEYRLACKEPGCNALLQSPVGKFFRSRLLHEKGISLRDQSRNQSLAQVGSLTRKLATIDLSSASDSISQRLIFELFPIEWVKLLDDLRSPWGFVPDGPTSKDGTWIRWSKHSTMGNGYTFEMESMIFYAIVMACVKTCRSTLHGPMHTSTLHDVSVYGDDIICPTYAAPLVVEALKIFGFTTNVDKSFIEGPFRESCGEHYHNGVNVTPFYVRKPVNSVSRMIWYLNRVKRWGSVDGIADPRTFDYWKTLKRKYVPSDLWGGVNSESVLSLHTIESPRGKLTVTVQKRQITGAPALLRAFQYQSKTVNHDHVKWLKIDEEDPFHRKYRGVTAEFLKNEKPFVLDGASASFDPRVPYKERVKIKIPDARRGESWGISPVNDDLHHEPVFYAEELQYG